MLRHLSQLARRYDARALKRFPPARRYALCACFLVEVQKTLLDHGVALHDQYLMEICRKSRNRFEKRHRQLRRRAKKGVETLIKTTKALLAQKQAPDGSIATRLQGLDEPSLQEAIESCEEFRRLEERGYVDELRARYSPLRRYLPAFLKLPFCGEPGNESLLTGIDLVRKLDAGELKKLPEDAPTDWVPPAFQVALRDEDGVIDRRTWEIGLSLAIRDAPQAPVTSTWPRAAAMSRSGTWSTMRTDGTRSARTPTGSCPSSASPAGSRRSSSRSLIAWPGVRHKAWAITRLRPSTRTA